MTAPDTQPAPASGEGDALREVEFALGRYVSRSHAHHIATEAMTPIVARLVAERDEAREKVRRVAALARLEDCDHPLMVQNPDGTYLPRLVGGWCPICDEWSRNLTAALGGEQAGDGGREGK